jgi:CheY-like chemotaxis protein
MTKTLTHNRPVLLVEDDPDIRSMMSWFLEQEGYRVLTAPSGEDALPILEREPVIGLLLVDLTMPGMNVRELRDAARAFPQHASVPMVLISGDSSLKQKAASVGATGYIEKPLELPVLLAVVEKFC